MTIRHTIAAICFSLTAPSLAAAQTQPSAGENLPLSTIEQRLTADGFRVVEIERYANSVEVKGYDRAGQCMELYLHPRTGDVLRRERDDDCSRSDRSDDSHHRGHSSDSDDLHRRRGGR